MKVKTIDIDCKEWFDRINGNSYFAGTVTINFGMEDEKTINIPFKYGYGSHYIHTAIKAVKDAGYITANSLHELTEQGIIVRYGITPNCKKRELLNY